MSTIVLVLFAFQIEMTGYVAVTLLLSIFSVFIYKDHFWKVTIPLYKRSTFRKRFESLAFSKVTILASSLNLILVLYEYLGSNLQNLIGNLTFFSVFLVFAFAFYLANFVVKYRMYRLEIERKINSSGVTWFNPSSI
ncbi:MAG: hypothetical protein ACFFFG_17895 [Candidatus Thorarchaeota archaeon]